MQQLSFFDDTTEDVRLSRIINVASVPQRSPFRYPGGKTWLVPYIRKWLKQLPELPTEFIEPFAGGGIVSLTVAFEELARCVTMVELDKQVASVWETILDKDYGKWLANEIVTFEFTEVSVRSILSRLPATRHEQAFQTILRNRVNRGGILANGAGMVRNGENGKGLKSRWYPTTLKSRILAIIAIKDRLNFVEGDGLKILKEKAGDSNTVFFIDPPYTAAGKRAGSRLYTCAELNHEELFQVASTLKGDFLMTYDNTEEIRAMATNYGLDTEPVAMKNTHHAKMSELLIGRNLNWLRH